MKILVTGGAGFIGSNLISIGPFGASDTFVAIDKLTYAADPRYLQTALGEGRAQLVCGDIADERLVYNLLHGIDAVIHLAAESHNTRSESDPEVFFKTNVEGTRSLMTTIRRFLADHPEKRIHVTYVSTDEVYGPARPGVFFKEEDFGKPDNQPTSAYSKSKYQADYLMQTEFDDLQPLIVRPTNNFGARQHPEKALPRWICAAIDNKPIEVWGEGKQVRDWLYVGDTSKIITCLIAYGKTGVINIGANHQPEITNIEIARKVSAILEKDESLIKFVPDPRPKHDFRYGVDTMKLRNLRVVGEDVWPGNFEKQLLSTVRWYLNNEAIWRPKIAEAEALYK